MNKNITLSQDFFKQHFAQKDDHPQNVIDLDANKRRHELQSIKETDLLNVRVSLQAHRERYEVDIESYPHPLKNDHDPVKDEIGRLQFQKIIYECAIEILEKPVLNEKLVDRSYLSRPKKIQKSEQELFISILEENFPSDDAILKKLNQNISPLPTELLRCLRVDFSDENEFLEENIE